MRILVVLIMLFTGAAHAEIPTGLEDGEITVTLKDGSTHTFKTNEFKVVPRVQKRLPAPVLVRAKKVSPPDKEGMKFSTILHVGFGDTGLGVSQSSGFITVREKRDLVVGATLCAEGEDGTGGCVSAFSNDLTMVGVKIGF